MRKRSLIYPQVNLYKTFLCIVFLSYGCNSKIEQEKKSFDKYVVDDVSVHLSVEDAPFLGVPVSIKAVSEDLLIVDSGYFQITKVDKNGNLILSFGKRGRGPGEFQSITGFWALKNEYLIYDYNSFKFSTFDYSGTLIDEEVLDENPLGSDSKYNIPITLDAISIDTLIVPTGGRQGSLFATVDRINEEVKYIGNAVLDSVKQTQEGTMQIYSKGEIPDIQHNMVMLGNNSSAIYSFQQTTGILEKFTYDGDLIWRKSLIIPDQENLFDTIKKYNQDVGFRLYLYARGMEVKEDGVALVLNLPDGQPLTIAWIPNDGSKIKLVEVAGITLEGNGFMEGITISSNAQYAYYLKRSIGTIYRFSWPFD